MNNERKKTKPILDKALKRIDTLPDDQFGDIDVDLKSFPKIKFGKNCTDKTAALQRYAQEKGYEVDHKSTNEFKKAFGKEESE